MRRTSNCRGKKIQLEFEVLGVKKLKLPELTEEFLQEIGNFGSEQELREAIRKNLQRQMEYQQQTDRAQPDLVPPHQERRLGAAAGAVATTERSRA